MSVPNIEDDILAASSRTLATEAVASQVGLMTGISIATIIAFNLLRPKNKIIYEPKVKYHEGSKPPPRISDSLFGWLPPLIHTKEPELVEKIGLDAATFLRFLRLMRWLFTGIALLTCGVLIPINYIYTSKLPRYTKAGAKRPDLLGALTIRDVGGNLLFAHVAMSYVITILVVGFLYVHWKHMLRLRHQWFRSPEYTQSFYARTLAITHVPKELKSDQGLVQLFNSVKVPYPTTSVHIGRKVGTLPDLIEFHNDTVREFEKVLVKYLKGGKLGKKRPTIRVGGTCGMGGVKKDAIDYYTAKLKRTEQAVEDYRQTIDTHKAENYGFASMAAVPYAHIVARQLRSKHPKGTNIALAPNPKDIIWKNMNLSDSEIARKKIHGTLWLILVCFLNTLPLLVISALANLEALTKYVPFLEKWKEASKATFVIVSGVLPPAIGAIFGFFLPIIMRFLTRYMGALTHSRLDRAVVARYFFFLIISQLVIFTLLGVIFRIFQELILKIGKGASFEVIVKGFKDIPDVINRTYIDQSSYWLTFFPLRGFLVVFDLAQIINLVWIFIKTHLFGRTPRDIREWTQPPEFDFAIYYSNILFMGAVGIVFAPLAPLVALAATVVFWLSSFVYKYQLMFVFVSKVETGGRIWNVIMNRILASVILMQLLMILTLGLQFRFRSFLWVSAIPPILIVIGFKIYVNQAFLPHFNFHVPSESEVANAKVHSERADNKGNRLEKRFGHPSLHTELFTPMLHARMMPLLSQVYSGKIGQEKTKMDEYGGQKMDAQVVGGGIRIAAINQSDLEYDPALYRRDRGELDWDAQSMASTAYLQDNGSTFNGAGKGSGYGNVNGSTTTLLPGYDRYMNQGPHGASQEQFELTRLDSANEPLLSPTSMAFHQQQHQHQQQQQQYHQHQQQQAGRHSPAPSLALNMNAGGRQSPGPSSALGSGRQSPGPYNAMNAGRQSPGPQSAYHNPQARHSPGPSVALGSGRQSPGPNLTLSLPPASYNDSSSPRQAPVHRPQQQQQQYPPAPHSAYTSSPLDTPHSQHGQHSPFLGAGERSNSPYMTPVSAHSDRSQAQGQSRHQHQQYASQPGSAPGRPGPHRQYTSDAGGYGERPSPQRQYSQDPFAQGQPQPSYHQQQQHQQQQGSRPHTPQGSGNGNMAGRGVYRG